MAEREAQKNPNVVANSGGNMETKKLENTDPFLGVTYEGTVREVSNLGESEG
jgi:hypothetical protein